MLRVKVEYFDSHITLKLKGELNGSAVEELERCWRTLACIAPSKPLQVELASVDVVSLEGRELIGKMVAAGVEMIALSPMLKAIVEEAKSEVHGELAA